MRRASWFQITGSILLATVVAAALEFAGSGAERAQQSARAAAKGGTTVFVDVAATALCPDANGTSGNPFPSITCALDFLQNTSPPTPWTVSIAAGAYDASVETFPLVLNSDTTLMGTPESGDGDPLTIIDGTDNPVTDRALIEAIDADNIHLQDLVVSNQQRTGGGTQQGGGAELRNVAGAIVACVFAGNLTRRAGGALWLSIASSGSFDITQSEFRDNRAEALTFIETTGGAIHIDTDYSGLFAENVIERNTCLMNDFGNPFRDAFGGGIYFGGTVSRQVGARQFEDNVFSDNVVNSVDGSTFGGGVYVDGSIDCDILRCEFSNNVARSSFRGQGGGVYCDADLGSDTSPRQVSQCTFNGNSAQGNGGAIRIAGSLFGSVAMSMFDSNIASNANVFEPIAGGAVSIGINWTSGGDAVVSSTFSGNSVAMGDFGNPTADANGGAISVGGDLTGGITETTLTENTANSVDGLGRGGAIHVGNSWLMPSGDSVSISSSTFDTNAATGSAGGSGVRSMLRARWRFLSTIAISGAVQRSSTAARSLWAMCLARVSRTPTLWSAQFPPGYTLCIAVVQSV